ncbi:c-type cytochrome domain-containing protein [Sphingobacterium siyangense]|uniref:c-type cytochrome domain-containing protein n=1 Tax=Sphingobacterium siyangense TaxID=459529 RepID=UPI003DA1F239
MIVFFDELLGFLGRFHPLLVHLPIGILLLAFVMAIRTQFKGGDMYLPAIKLSLFLGTIAAIIAALSGYLLSRNGGYEEDVLSYHKWLGIAVAISSLWLWFLYRKESSGAFRFWLFFILVLLIGVTGHYGGTLTHGKGYFVEAMPVVLKKLFKTEEAKEEVLIVQNAQEAEAYKGIIQPILKQRCQSCHGQRKQEGGLALDTKENLLKGGENGTVLNANDSKKSELYARLVLPEGHKKRMPPKGRTPITADQIKLIAWWIDQGANFDKKVHEIPQTEEIAHLLKKLETGEKEESAVLYADLPAAPSLPKDKVDAWQAKGIKIIQVARDNNFVLVNAINYPQFNDKDLQELLAIKDNIVQLKLGNTAVTDLAFSTLSAMPILSRLHLENTKISDAGLSQLKGLSKLTYLNLTGTKVTSKGLSKLNELPSLKNLYLYKTLNQEVAAIKQLNAKIKADTGNYSLPFIETDTIRF